jgi:hypothetical protein
VDAQQHQGVLGPNAVTYLDAALSTLHGTPHRGQDKLEAIGVLSGLVRLLVTSEIADARVGRRMSEWRDATTAHLISAATDGEHPHLAAVLEAARGESPTADGLFDRVLMRALAGLLSNTTPSGRTRSPAAGRHSVVPGARSPKK